jgi:hypothetical protein
MKGVYESTRRIVAESEAGSGVGREALYCTEESDHAHPTFTMLPKYPHPMLTSIAFFTLSGRLDAAVAVDAARRIGLAVAAVLGVRVGAGACRRTVVALRSGSNVLKQRAVLLAEAGNCRPVALTAPMRLVQ